MATAASQIRDEAEALAVALKIDACDVADVIAWADAQIARDDAPSGALCDVSLGGDRNSQDVAELLREFPGTPSQSNVNRLLVTLINDLLRRDTGRAPRIALALYRLYDDDRIEDSHLRAVAGWADDALDLVEAGYLPGSREEVVERIALALDDAASRAAVSWSFALGA